MYKLIKYFSNHQHQQESLFVYFKGGKGQTVLQCRSSKISVKQNNSFLNPGEEENKLQHFCLKYISLIRNVSVYATHRSMNTVPICDGILQFQFCSLKVSNISFFGPGWWTKWFSEKAEAFLATLLQKVHPELSTKHFNLLRWLLHCRKGVLFFDILTCESKRGWICSKQHRQMWRLTTRRAQFNDSYSQFDKCLCKL